MFKSVSLLSFAIVFTCAVWCIPLSFLSLIVKSLISLLLVQWNIPTFNSLLLIFHGMRCVCVCVCVPLSLCLSLSAFLYTHFDYSEDFVTYHTVNTHRLFNVWLRYIYEYIYTKTKTHIHRQFAMKVKPFIMRHQIIPTFDKCKRYLNRIAFILSFSFSFHISPQYQSVCLYLLFCWKSKLIFTQIYITMRVLRIYRQSRIWDRKTTESIEKPSG